MAKVTREMVERTGVEVEKLLDLLIRNAAAEITTFYYYTILRVNLIGLEGEGIKEIQVDQVLEVVTTDPDALKDFPDWARGSGNEILKTEEKGGIVTFWIKRVE